jgi:hypothetical protein
MKEKLRQPEDKCHITLESHAYRYGRIFLEENRSCLVVHQKNKFNMAEIILDSDGKTIGLSPSGMKYGRRMRTDYIVFVLTEDDEAELFHIETLYMFHYLLSHPELIHRSTNGITYNFEVNKLKTWYKYEKELDRK